MHLGIIASSKASYIKSLRRCSQKRWRLFEECSWNDSWVLPVCGGGGFWWMAANVALWQQTPARLQRASHPSFFYFSSCTPAASKAGRKGSYRFRSSNKTAASESREQNHSWARHTSGKQWWLFLFESDVSTIWRETDWFYVSEVISLRATHMMGFCTWFKVSEGKNPEENWDIRANPHFVMATTTNQPITDNLKYTVCLCTGHVELQMMR